MNFTCNVLYNKKLIWLTFYRFTCPTKKNSYLIFRETFSTKDDFELHNYFSDNLKTVYNAHYRSINQISALFNKNFKLSDEEIIFPATVKKPETFQHLLILKRIF